MLGIEIVKPENCLGFMVGAVIFPKYRCFVPVWLLHAGFEHLHVDKYIVFGGREVAFLGHDLCYLGQVVRRMVHFP